MRFRRSGDLGKVASGSVLTAALYLPQGFPVLRIVIATGPRVEIVDAERGGLICQQWSVPAVAVLILRACPSMSVCRI